MAKVAELEGALLDYWVARAECVKWAAIHEREGVPDWCGIGGDPRRTYSPSTDWAQGGPIIERFKIDVMCDSPVDKWMACRWNNEDDHEPAVNGYGPTPLIAAMRAYVASKFGETVPDEVQP